MDHSEEKDECEERLWGSRIRGSRDRLDGRRGYGWNAWRGLGCGGLADMVSVDFQHTTIT